MGKTVVLIEPGEHLGGLSSGGLGATDIGNKKAIGGIAREFYCRVRQHYQQDAAWNQESPENFNARSRQDADDAMWIFEPKVAEQIFHDLVRESGITLVLKERLDRSAGVELRDRAIAKISMESGRAFAGQVFIDATYEGDLMAAAGVSFVVGRESNSRYNETLNGVQTQHATKHQLQPGIDPYTVPGDPSSGLLFGVEPEHPAAEGTGDHRVQAYNFRICATDFEPNQIPFPRPENYDETLYELLFRNFEAGEDRIPWSRVMMPNRKTDCNNNFGASTDFIGQSYNWAEASYAEREEIFQRHLDYTRGLLWSLANHPRVPEPIRREMSRWGLCRDEFVNTGGWSHQLYIREARRMVSEVVMTQHHCQGRDVASDSIGLAAYTMDSHHVQRYVDASGHVRNEGDVQVGGFPPYPISYLSLVPRREECTNLLVPVCLSSSHIAFGSIRMEPVFMVLGQSAGTAACLSIDANSAVQDLRYLELSERLSADGQVLGWPPSELPPR
jgi:hypothetical protein